MPRHAASHTPGVGRARADICPIRWNKPITDPVGTIRRLGPQLVAFFAVRYYSALRPEEAINLRKHNLSAHASTPHSDTPVQVRVS